MRTPHRQGADLLPRRSVRRAWPTTWLLTACTVTSLSGQDLAFPTLPAHAPTGSGVVVTCHAASLLGTARCGVFRVSENRTDHSAGGRTLDLAFVILEALDPAERLLDAVVLLPGGPGQAFTGAAVRQSVLLPRELRRNRDVVLVDVRGVGRSAALSCDVPYPGGVKSRFGALFPLDHAIACRDALSRRAQLNQYTTAAAVDDLEDLRRWLGYSAVNLLGTSYGTRVAQVYLRRHPEAVRAAVLNGVAPVNEPVYVQHARLLQRALDRLLEECAADYDCRSAYPNLRGDLDSLIARVRREPVQVEAGGTRVAFGMGDLSYALRGLLYARGRDVPAFIHRAAGGQFTELAVYYLQRTHQFGSPDGNMGYHFSVLCAEDIAPLSDEDVAAATGGTFMGDHLIEGYRAVCRLWPHAALPAAHWTPVRSDVPTLLLSGSRDPVTPPEGGDAVAAHLRQSLHVVVSGGGHGVGGACINRMIVQLVTAGMIEAVDPSCVEKVPATRFATP